MSDLDGLHERVPALRQMRQRVQGLVTVRHRLHSGRAVDRFLSGLLRVAQYLVPDLAPKRMVNEPFDVLSQPVAQPCLKGLDDLGSPPPLLEERAVGHLMGEGMLEGVFALGEGVASHKVIAHPP